MRFVVFRIVMMMRRRMMMMVMTTYYPARDQIWFIIGIFGQFGPGHAGLFGALLVGRLVVVARRLYLARHLFTLYICRINSVFAKCYLQSSKIPK